MSDAEWLDRPTGDGAYWRWHPGLAIHTAQIRGNRMLRVGESHWTDIPPCDKWQRIPEPQGPPPPPPPLPKSRSVELTAKMWRDRYGMWFAIMYHGEDEFDRASSKDKEGLIEEVRSRLGIEPEVQDG